MKHILDKDFVYRPSYDTDIKRTFERLKKRARPKRGRIILPSSIPDISVLRNKKVA
jgi:hypothetical protein